jgi:hypothetical protein
MGDATQAGKTKEAITSAFEAALLGGKPSDAGTRDLKGAI